MARRMMLKDTGTGRWGWYTIGRPVRMPWERAWTRLCWVLRHALRFYGRTLVPPRELDYDPQTMTFRDRRAERMWLRRARRAEDLDRLHGALLSMVDMQKHIG